MSKIQAFSWEIPFCFRSLWGFVQHESCNRLCRFKLRLQYLSSQAGATKVRRDSLPFKSCQDVGSSENMSWQVVPTRRQGERLPAVMNTHRAAISGCCTLISFQTLVCILPTDTPLYKQRDLSRTVGLVNSFHWLFVYQFLLEYFFLWLAKEMFAIGNFCSVPNRPMRKGRRFQCDFACWAVQIFVLSEFTYTGVCDDLITCWNSIKKVGVLNHCF